MLGKWLRAGPVPGVDRVSMCLVAFMVPPGIQVQQLVHVHYFAGSRTGALCKDWCG